MRLIDLHCDWLWQYAAETTLFEPPLYAEVPQRLGRLDGYLQGTSLAVLTCKRKPEDWERQGDPWGSLAALLSAYEAEFAGRLLIALDDVARWNAEPADGLCWGTLGVAGFDFLVRGPADLDRLPVLFERGVRVFQLAATAANLLAGTSEIGDDRGLTDLGHAFLARLNDVSEYHAPGSMPIIDLAGLNSRSIAGILDRCEFQSSCRSRPLLMFSHGEVLRPVSETTLSLTHDQLVRFRALGGVVGLTSSSSGGQTTEELKALIDAIASIPFEGRSGHEGIAISTDFLACAQTLAGLAGVTQITKWVGRAFDRDAAHHLLAGNASRMLTRAAGLEPGAGPH